MDRQELLAVIKWVADEGSTQLDLSMKEIAVLPPEIGQLTELQWLNLGDNHLAALPPEIGQMTGLRQLHLYRNRLTELPSEIGQLTGLQTLYLFGNQLTTLPPEIWHLTSLQNLSLGDNQLVPLPPEIGRLTGLQTLNLGRNQLAVLPPEIGRLTSLHVLDLTDNQLTVLPPEIGRLTGLQRLNLDGNQLTTLPPEIGWLTSLYMLDLSDNHLILLPPEIGQLNNLQWLSIDDNQLTALPPGIGHLARLQWLYLDRNQITALPPKIGRLTGLQTLYLDGNQLTALPLEIRNLTQLKTLQLGGNPLPIPAEIIGQSRAPRAIINYYFTYLAGDTRPLNEVKLLLVGEGAVGKTSLACRMIWGDFDPHESETKGIAVQRWGRDLDGELLRVNLWDFGGQEVMHATHQFFLTERSLYLVVVDARAGERRSNLAYWLKLASGYGKDSPIIVVVNKIDQNPLDLDRAALKAAYPQIVAFVETSCMTGQGIDDLMAQIDTAIAEMPHVRDLMPLSWLNVKEKLEATPGSTISYEGYEAQCREEGITSKEDQRTLMGFLHALGSVLYFRDDPRLAEKGVLRPDWVTGAVYRIINDREVIERHGVLRFDDLPRILDRELYPRDSYLFILDLMSRFELLFTLPLSSDTYLLPDLLDKQVPPFGWDEENILHFQLNYDLLPGSILSRFIVQMHDYLEPDHWWRTGAVLADRGCRARVRADLDANRISVDVAGQPHLRRDFLSDIRAQLRNIQRRLDSLRVDERVPIPGKPEVTVSYEHLLRLSLIGKRDYLPDGLDEPVDVKLLLDGVASEEQQRADGVTFNIHIGDDIRVGDIVDSGGVAIGRRAQARVKQPSNPKEDG